MATAMRQYWAKVYGCTKLFGPFETREEAASQAAHGFLVPAKEIMTGYGSEGPYFDIRWIANPTYNPKE